MGTIFGKQSVAEPAFDVLFTRTTGGQGSQLPYEIRKYGTRFAAQVSYTPSKDNDDGSPFGLLAKYIGVFGTPENEGETSISMTAPVVKQQSKGGGGTPIAMTAPVVKTTSNKDEGDGHKQIMQFILPAEYTSLDQIPKPSNPAVTIQQIPPAVGAVHRYSGSFDDQRAASTAQSLAQQLEADGVKVGDETWVAQHYQFWGYNPPFTLPPFRRNEVWLPLTPEQVDRLTKGENNIASAN